MIDNFDDFCLWVYVIVGDMWQEIRPLFKRPGPQAVCSDSEWPWSVSVADGRSRPIC